MQPSTLAKRSCLLLFLTIIAFYFYGLSKIPFVGPDEPRYAQVAREMFQRHDLITPTLGGRAWFEKPALLYWMMVAGFSLFGVSELAARLGPAISGLLTVAAVYWLGRRLEQTGPDSSDTGLACWSALVAATMLGLIVFARGASFDIVVTMTITWALSFFLVVDLEENHKHNQLYLAGFYVFTGLSLLAKGLVGVVLPLGVVAVYYLLLWKMPGRRVLASFIWGLPLALAVSAIWYAPVIGRHGWPFINEFFVQHHFARYVSNKYHHPEAVYFYLLVLLALTLPWTAFLISGLLGARNWHWRAASAKDKGHLFALASMVFPLVFFSFAGSKLPGYILPVLPAAALLSGDRLNRFIADERGAWAMGATGAIFVWLALGGIYYAQQSGNLSFRCALLVAAPLIAAGMFAILTTRRRATAAVALICAFLTAIAVVLNCGVATAKRESTRDLLALASAKGYNSTPVYALHQIDRSAEFYAAGRVAYDSEGQPVRFESAAQVLAAAQLEKGPVLVIVPVKYVNQLTALNSARVEVLGDNQKVALVAVVPE